MAANFKTGDIVWVNLGHSYGHWPAEICEEKDENKPQNGEKKEDLAKKFVPLHDLSSKLKSSEISKEANNSSGILRVRFFDDDKFEVFRVMDAKMVESYSCKDKVNYIRAGLTRFSTENKKSILDNQTRQSQFIKDVEVAEVMTDNDPEVGQILGEEVYLDVDPASMQEPEDGAKKRKSGKGSKRGKKRKR